MSKSALNRRRFCRVAGAAVASPWLIPAAARGADGNVAPSERITLAYIGTGPRGRLNCREALRSPGARVVAVCDVWDHARDRAKQEVDAHYGTTDCATYVDFRDILARDDIDAVSIASPDHWHVPMAVMAAEAGKDVSLEKPMGVSFAEDQACRATIHRLGRVFQYGTEARSIAACRHACELIRNGVLGELREIRVKAPDSVAGGSRQPKPVPDGLNYDLWLGPAPWRPYSGCPDNGGSWFHVRDYALGFIAGWAAHPLDLLVWAFDAHEHGPWTVRGTGLIDRAPGCNDAVRQWDVHIDLAGGVPIHFWANSLSKDEPKVLASRGDYVQFIGTEGWIAPRYGGFDCHPASLAETRLGPGAKRLPVAAGQETNFIRCVHDRTTPVSHVDDAVRSDMISHVADIAIRCERPITWDPIAERIIDDEQAARRLTRALREPWRI